MLLPEDDVIPTEGDGEEAEGSIFYLYSKSMTFNEECKWYIMIMWHWQ